MSQEILITGLYAVKLTELKHLPWTQVHPAMKTDGRALCVGIDYDSNYCSAPFWCSP
ncbi:hypothetical protein PAMC26510_04010 [Caballeronia sordidicola]|uniref:Uncharacterized protein n=1 Tax=Caballeronia sordidicola TaxID=196367 RepID=A0A242N8D1_CABSO|nr:hypothetical protein PAMC26510_04010 [Caballeronia sordidicola]